jgi:hypothetical protein
MWAHVHQHSHNKRLSTGQQAFLMQVKPDPNDTLLLDRIVIETKWISLLMAYLRVDNSLECARWLSVVPAFMIQTLT